MLPLVLMLLTQVPVVISPPDDGCVRNPETGAVTCAGQSFDALVDKVLEARGARDACQLRRTVCESRLAAVEAALLVKPTVVEPPKKLPVKPVVAVMTAIVGAAALSTAVLHEKMDTGARVGLGAAGTVAVSAAFIINF